MIEGRFFTAEELCARWRDVVSPRTLERWRTKNIGPRVTKIGGRPLYLDKHVIEYEEAQTAATDA